MIEAPGLVRGPTFIKLAKPQPGPQQMLLACPADEILFGGARGGGKTSGAILLWIQHMQKWGAGAQGIFFRRRYRDLEGAQIQMHKFFRPLGANWRHTSASWTFPNGAILRLRHMWDEKDAEAYQGHEYSFLCFEEAGQFPTSAAIDKLRATQRSTAGVKPIMLLTANPGGAGHGWIKARYVTPARRGMKVLYDDDGGTRTFIPSSVDDNQILMESDPRYKSRLARTGSPTLVKAWLEGDWDVVVGGFFDDVWNPGLQILAPFLPPPSWTWRRSFDWGFSRPASLNIMAVSDGTSPAHMPDRRFPKGSIVVVGELYTVRKDDNGEAIANEGLGLSNVELGRAVARASQAGPGRRYRESVADPSVFTAAGGASIEQQMREAAIKAGDPWGFIRAVNNRTAGWTKMRTMLEQSSRETPEDAGLWVCENCTDWIRTVPVLQKDPAKPEDVDTAAEDHAADSCRYGIMAGSRVTTGGLSGVNVRQ